MSVDPQLLEAQKQEAIQVWKWKSPYVAAILALIHPLGLRYTSVYVFIVYFGIWGAVVFYWHKPPLGAGTLFAFIFAVYAFYATKQRNRAIEKWRYGLPGTGLANPRKLGLELEGPDASRKPFIGKIGVKQRASEALPTVGFSTRLNEGFQLVGDTTANFAFAGLFLGLGVFTDSQFFRLICHFAVVALLWLGYMRPTHSSQTHRIALVIGAVPCVVAGFSAR